MQKESANRYILLLMGIVILLMVAIIGLFIRMNQLQSAVEAALAGASGPSMEGLGLEIGSQAPEFTAVDTEGETVSLGDYAGQRVLLVFASSRCGACLAMFPNLEQISQTRQDYQVLMFLYGSSEEIGEAGEQYGFSFPILNWETEIQDAYAVRTIPFFYLIGEDGEILNSAILATYAEIDAFLGGS